MVLPSKPVKEDPTQVPGFSPDGLNSNQNAAVELVKSLITNLTRQRVEDACPVIESALVSNNPALTVAEAHELWKGLFWFTMCYSGALAENLHTLLSKIEAMFPEEKF